jgi:hypothetical protein
MLKTFTLTCLSQTVTLGLANTLVPFATTVVSEPFKLPPVGVENQHRPICRILFSKEMFLLKISE